MGVKKTYEEINEKIRKGQAVVVTAEEVIGIVEKGIESSPEIDVVTTGTFGPMCSRGVPELWPPNPRIKLPRPG